MGGPPEVLHGLPRPEGREGRERSPREEQEQPNGRRGVLLGECAPRLLGGGRRLLSAFLVDLTDLRPPSSHIRPAPRRSLLVPPAAVGKGVSYARSVLSCRQPSRPAGGTVSRVANNRFSCVMPHDRICHLRIIEV